MINLRSFTARLTLALAVLLLSYGALVGLVGRYLAAEHEQEALQRLSHGLAGHIVGHWPQISKTQTDPSDKPARDALMSMLMVVNPGVQVYVLDAAGRVDAYIGEPGMVRESQVDLAPVRAFLAGAALPLRGTDPMGSGVPRIFSAAMFEPASGDARPPGYLYVVLDGQARLLVAGQVGHPGLWRSAGWMAALGLLVTLALGGLMFRQLTAPLNRLGARMRAYSTNQVDVEIAKHGKAQAIDEVQAISLAFDDLTQRLRQQADQDLQRNEAHREMMASVAHDLRTPLTALHGHLEALSSQQTISPRPCKEANATDHRERLMAAALAQSDKVRRLSQQLFELASLQSAKQVLHLERFCLEELVTDAVQKFDLSNNPTPVTLSGEPPGRLELDGDLQLIERAITNLIDNAMRHAPGVDPVRVSVRRAGPLAQIWVEDAGPGLPPELRDRLEQGQSLRDPPIKRIGGGIGGLGLAIAQRVAILHGGSLLPLAAQQGGTRICLALPLALATSPAALEQVCNLP